MNISFPPSSFSSVSFVSEKMLVLDYSELFSETLKVLSNVLTTAIFTHSTFVWNFSFTRKSYKDLRFRWSWLSWKLKKMQLLYFQSSWCSESILLPAQQLNRILSSRAMNHRLLLLLCRSKVAAKMKICFSVCIWSF